MNHNTEKDHPDLQSVRAHIDSIDQQIQSLLNDRAAAALKVAEIKMTEAGDGAVDFYRPEREAQILRRVAERNTGPMDSRALQVIFREIISASLALEEPLRVSYLGPAGTFTHTAAHRHFGHAVMAQAESSIAGIFQSVEAGRARFGVVPIENSIEGSVNQTLDQLTRTPLRVCGEIRMRIQHCLLGNVTELVSVREVHAHPQALAQCSDWLDANLPGAERVSASSNAAAATLVAGSSNAAAIASDTAAQLYDLGVMVTGIENSRDNTTRFIVIGNQVIPPSGEDASLLLVAAPHRPGGLRRILQPLEEANVSMTRIESRPSRTGLWDYVFFIDVDGHELDPGLSTVLDELRDLAPLLKVLGSYPRAL